MRTIQTSCFWQALLCFCLASPVLAQPASADSTKSIPATRAAIFYQAYIGPDAAIYNGLAYQPNYRGVNGEPYFQTPNLSTGTLVYEGITYTRIPLLYDLVQDNLVISDPKGQLLVVSQGKVQQFTLGDHTFTSLRISKTPGYYERLTAGYASLFVRHTKKIGEKIEIHELYRSISSHDEYYLLKQDRFYPVESGDHLLTLLADKKKELRQFQHAQHIRFKKDPATAMTAIVDHYNQFPH